MNGEVTWRKRESYDVANVVAEDQDRDNFSHSQHVSPQLSPPSNLLQWKHTFASYCVCGSIVIIASHLPEHLASKKSISLVVWKPCSPGLLKGISEADIKERRLTFLVLHIFAYETQSVRSYRKSSSLY